MTDIEMFNESTARELDSAIRAVARQMHLAWEALVALVEAAKAQHIHKALGFPSWTAYIADALDGQWRVERDKRGEVVKFLAAQGMSQRVIVKVTGIGKGTVYRELAGAPLGQVITGTDGKTYRPKRKPKPKPPKPEQPTTTEPPGGLTENSPGQTERVKRIVENNKAARDATEPAPDDTDTGPDLGIALSGIAADLDKLAVYITALDTNARLKVLDDHFGAINDVSRKLQRTIKALRVAQKIRAQEKEG